MQKISEEKVIELIKERFDIDVTPDSNLSNEGVDSLDMIDLEIEIERELGTLNNDTLLLDLSFCETVKDIVSRVND